MAFGWRVPAPDEAMLISGGKQKGNEGLTFKIVTGHGAFVLPIFRKASFLSLSMQESQVAEQCNSQQGITLLCRAVIAFKVGDDFESIANAARRFLADQKDMETLTGRIFAGHLRSIVGSMTVEDIIRQRQRLAEEILDASKPEMEKLGLIVDSFQIQSIDDQGAGYIQALAAPHQATVQRDAQIAQAKAQQEAQIAQAQAAQAAAQAQQESERTRAEYERQTAVAKAGYKAEVDTAQATADAAGPLTQAKAQQDVIDAQAALAKKNAELAEQRLVAEVQKPADAEAYKIKVLAQAQADQTRLQAEAMAAGQGVTIQRALVDQMPAIMSAVSQQLSNANITILNGADGLSSLVGGLASQAGTLLDLFKIGIGNKEVSLPLSSTTEREAVLPTRNSK